VLNANFYPINTFAYVFLSLVVWWSENITSTIHVLLKLNLLLWICW